MFSFTPSRKAGPVFIAGILATLALWLAGSAILPAASGAASTTYAGGESTTFAASQGGWQSSENYAGLCVQNITCPQIGGSYQSSGGTGGDGDGYIQTTSGQTTVAALLSASTQIWGQVMFWTHNPA